jgi:hypothetical protein
MTKSQLDAAMKVAQDKTVKFVNDNGQHLEDITICDGFGLSDFGNITCTIRQLAFLIRWQCFRLNGSIDSESLQEIVTHGRRKFTVIGN